MKILVTGGNGFAGRFVSRFFADLGYEVTATYRTAKPENLPGEIRYVRQELSEEIAIDGDFDAIVHTACSKSGKILEMEEYVRDNVDSARELVRFARKKCIKTILFFSTRSVYGDIHRFDVDETTDIVNPGKYGLTKYIAEQIFQEAEDIQTVGFRFPGIIGPGAHDIWLVWLVEQIMKGKAVEVSNFETTNLVWMEDVSRFIHKLLKDADDGKAFKYPVVNLACSETINNVEIANLIKDRSCSKSKIKVAEAKLAAPDVKDGLFRLNTARAREMGFESSSPRDIVNGYLNYAFGKEKRM